MAEPLAFRRTSEAGRQHRTVVTTAQLERMYASFLLPVYRFVYSRLGNRQDAEDVTSLVFMKAIDYVNPDAAPQEIEAYLFRIARTNIADHWRRYAGLRVVSIDQDPSALLVEEPTSADHLQTGESLTTELEGILAQLPPNYRRVLELRFYQGCSIKETAAAMHVTETNAKVLQYRAIQRAASLARVETVVP